MRQNVTGSNMPIYYEYKGEIPRECEHPNFPGGRRWKVGSVWQCRDCKKLFFIVAKDKKRNAMWYLLPKEIDPPIPEDAIFIWDEWIKVMLDQWEKEGCPIYNRDLDKNVITPGYEIDLLDIVRSFYYLLKDAHPSLASWNEAVYEHHKMIVEQFEERTDTNA